MSMDVESKGSDVQNSLRVSRSRGTYSNSFSISARLMQRQLLHRSNLSFSAYRDQAAIKRQNY